MCLYSDFWRRWERHNLAPYAVKSDDPWYAQRVFSGEKNEDDYVSFLDPAGNESRYKTDFGIDIERILNSQAFRRLEYKTQMFVNHEGDNYRTRLTHTLEVVMIAKYIAKALRLNTDLVESIGLGHDLGHAPFGHAGEDAINEMIEERINVAQKNDIKENYKTQYYFCHNRQSLEVVEQLEKSYDWDRRSGKDKNRGINLTLAAREGIVVHTNRGLDQKKLRKNYKEKNIKYPGSLEAQVVRLSDEIAQRTHDLEDGLRSGLIKKNEIIVSITTYIESLVTQVSTTERDNNFMEFGGSTFPIGRFDEEISNFSNNLHQHNISFEKKDLVKYLKKLFIVITRLLFLWRDNEYFKKEAVDNKDDFKAYTNRILKYVHVYLNIKYNLASAFNINGFLRGLFISNAIEYSFSVIKHNLKMDPEVELLKDSPENKDNSNEESEAELGKDLRFLVFVDFDDAGEPSGMVVRIDPDQNNQPANGPWLDSNGGTDGKLNKELEIFKPMIESWLDFYKRSEKAKNLIYAEVLTGKNPIKHLKVNWLNKHKHIEKCSRVEIYTDNSKILSDDDSSNLSIITKIDQVQIYFGQLDYDLHKFDKDSIQELLEPKIIIKHSDEMKGLDESIQAIIKKCVHHNSKVERMNVKGKMLISELFRLYWKFPRIMHSRVWESLKIYSNFETLTAKEPFLKYDGCTPNDDQIKQFHNIENYDAQILLCRRIIDHISGMTDRFIYDEYARLFSTTKDIERAEEIRPYA
jgi:predicted deoxyguanosinetriphosphate triphosphohydrolase